MPLLKSQRCVVIITPLAPAVRFVSDPQKPGFLRVLLWRGATCLLNTWELSVCPTGVQVVTLTASWGTLAFYAPISPRVNQRSGLSVNPGEHDNGH